MNYSNYLNPDTGSLEYGDLSGWGDYENHKQLPPQTSFSAAIGPTRHSSAKKARFRFRHLSGTPNLMNGNPPIKHAHASRSSNQDTALKNTRVLTSNTVNNGGLTDSCSDNNMSESVPESADFSMSSQKYQLSSQINEVYSRESFSRTEVKENLQEASKPLQKTSDSTMTFHDVANQTSLKNTPRTPAPLTVPNPVNRSYTQTGFSGFSTDPLSSSDRLNKRAPKHPGNRSRTITDTISSSQMSEEDMQVDDVRSYGAAVSTGLDEDIQVYLSVVWHGEKLGMAYYDLDATQIYMMMDVAETDQFNLLKRAVRQIQPMCIIVSSKSDERLMKLLKSYVNNDSFQEEEDNYSSNNENFQILPSIDFSLDVCKRRILTLDLPTIPKHYTESERILHLSSLIPFDSICMVRSVGALLKYIEKRRLGVELETVDVQVPVLDLKIFSLEDQVIIDDTAISSLQIFQREFHPSVYKSGQSSGAKEGLSVFGILNRCKSQIGSRKLRNWFLQPTRNLRLLKQRHDAISFFVNPRNLEVVNTLQDCLKHIKNVPRILHRMLQAQASIGDWQALYKTAYHAIYIGDLCRGLPGNIEIFKMIGQKFTEDLHRIATLIGKIVDFDESSTQNRFVVKSNVDTDLDEKKRTYNGLPDLMTKVAKEELNKLSDNINECNVIYLPQLGYLLAIPLTRKPEAEQDLEIDGLQFVFLSNNLVHYKSESTRELDRVLGDTQCEITDHETSIMHRLQNTILEHSKVLPDVMEYAAQLDCLMALATCARELNFSKPDMVTEDTLDIKGGRHPLQELCCSPFVPNDTTSNQEQGKMKILTGPNASGKSVYLKQVGLIVYMAHIGSFVPAESATIGTIDRIYTRIKSLDSISVGLSTFMLDINQMSEALRNATKQSLVIVDEFGKGTELADGLALLCASAKYWLKMEENCPHVLVSTHFHSITNDSLLPRSPQLKYLTMETLHNGDELVFLYQLVEGHRSSSYANHIASQAGLPQEIISRGSEVSKLIREHKPVHRVDSESTETQLKRFQSIVDKYLQLDLDRDDVQAFLNNFVLQVHKGEI